MRIAIVGAGIAGITAAHLLAKRHDVTLIERERAIGGHTNTVIVDDDGVELPVDTGFIVCNPKTYPNFYRLLAEWGVSLRESDMSFGFSCEKTGLGYVGPSIRDFMRKPTNLLNPRILRLLHEQRRFNRRALDDLKLNRLGEITLGEYVSQAGVSDFFVEHYVLPLAGAVWSSPDEDMLRFPAATFLRFFDNHGMLDLKERPTWQTIVGGSHAYLQAFEAKFRGAIEVGSAVRAVTRCDDAVLVTMNEGPPRPFDRVIMATHADTTLALLTEATDDERNALAAWSYHKNHVQLHTDSSVMPADRRLWASWNYRRRMDRDSAAPVSITYSMNRLQGLTSARDYFVSLNARDHVNPDSVLYETIYTHPGYTPGSIKAQEQLREMGGQRRIFFCGAHMRYGFHEDGVVSALDVASHFGVTL